MATKEGILKKKLIKEGIIVGVLVLALAGAGWFVSDSDDAAAAEKEAKENENSSMQSEQNNLQRQLGRGTEASSFYDYYTQNHSTEFGLQRETGASIMASLRESNHLANLAVSIAPISDTPIETIQLERGKTVKSEVKLQFGAVIDSSIYGYIEALERKLPGFMVIEELKFSRNNDLSQSIILGLSQHHLTPLITGELAFSWIGIAQENGK